MKTLVCLSMFQAVVATPKAEEDLGMLQIHLHDDPEPVFTECFAQLQASAAANTLEAKLGVLLDTDGTLKSEWVSHAVVAGFKSSLQGSAADMVDNTCTAIQACKAENPGLDEHYKATNRGRHRILKHLCQDETIGGCSAMDANPQIQTMKTAMMAQVLLSLGDTTDLCTNIGHCPAAALTAKLSADPTGVATQVFNMMCPTYQAGEVDPMKCGAAQGLLAAKKEAAMTTVETLVKNTVGTVPLEQRMAFCGLAFQCIGEHGVTDVGGLFDDVPIRATLVSEVCGDVACDMFGKVKSFLPAAKQAERCALPALAGCNACD